MTITEQYIENRIIDEAKYIVNNMETVRNASKHFGVSKSTIHKDITKRLSEINSGLAEEVAIIMELNAEEKHIRGGNSTKIKYKSAM